VRSPLRKRTYSWTTGISVPAIAEYCNHDPSAVKATICGSQSRFTCCFSSYAFSRCSVWLVPRFRGVWWQELLSGDPGLPSNSFGLWLFRRSTCKSTKKYRIGRGDTQYDWAPTRRSIQIAKYGRPIEPLTLGLALSMRNAPTAAGRFHFSPVVLQDSDW
jgi:hypothetical protein